jgi:hypothetical protein
VVSYFNSIYKEELSVADKSISKAPSRQKKDIFLIAKETGIRELASKFFLSPAALCDNL